jgi:hypothetical protein
MQIYISSLVNITYGVLIVYSKIKNGLYINDLPWIISLWCNNLLDLAKYKYTDALHTYNPMLGITLREWRLKSNSDTSVIKDSIHFKRYIVPRQIKSSLLWHYST